MNRLSVAPELTHQMLLRALDLLVAKGLIDGKEVAALEDEAREALADIEKAGEISVYGSTIDSDRV